MRVVIFDDESLEPVTVVNLLGLTDKCLEEQQLWRVSLERVDPEPDLAGPERNSDRHERYVDLEFERISRLTLRHGQQVTWMCITRASDLAMLLTPDWLPGQRAAIDHLQAENERLANLMVDTLMSRES